MPIGSKEEAGEQRVRRIEKRGEEDNERLRKSRETETQKLLIL